MASRSNKHAEPLSERASSHQLHWRVGGFTHPLCWAIEKAPPFEWTNRVAQVNVHFRHRLRTRQPHTCVDAIKEFC